MVEEYLLSEDKDKNKITKVFVVDDHSEQGIRIKTVIETLDSKGEVKDTKESDKYYPEKVLVRASSCNGIPINEIVG